MMCGRLKQVYWVFGSSVRQMDLRVSNGHAKSYTNVGGLILLRVFLANVCTLY